MIEHSTPKGCQLSIFVVAVSELKPKREVHVRGEFWQAKTEEEQIRKGKKVEVVGREEMFLIVKSIKEKV